MVSFILQQQVEFVLMQRGLEQQRVGTIPILRVLEPLPQAYTRMLRVETPRHLIITLMQRGLKQSLAGRLLTLRAIVLKQRGLSPMLEGIIQLLMLIKQLLALTMSKKPETQHLEIVLLLAGDGALVKMLFVLPITVIALVLEAGTPAALTMRSFLNGRTATRTARTGLGCL